MLYAPIVEAEFFGSGQLWIKLDDGTWLNGDHIVKIEVP